MKTKLFLAVSIIFVSTSCFKEHYCSCTKTTSDGQTSTYGTEVEGNAPFPTSKKSLKAACAANNESNSYSTTTCTLTN